MFTEICREASSFVRLDGLHLRPACPPAIAKFVSIVEQEAEAFESSTRE